MEEDYIYTYPALATMYAGMIIRGTYEYSKVPSLLKADVRAKLTELGYAQLIK